MELWEFNACIRSYNKRQKNESQKLLYAAWQTASFTGAAFVGKLKDFNRYSGEATEKSEVELTPEEMEALDKRLAEKNREEVRAIGADEGSRSTDSC